MRTTREEQERLCEEWQHSGVKLAEFARQMNIPYHRIQYWVRQRREREAVDVNRGEHFIQCAVPRAASTRGASPSNVVIRLDAGGQGASIVLDGQTSPTYVAQLLREVLR